MKYERISWKLIGQGKKMGQFNFAIMKHGDSLVADRQLIIDMMKAALIDHNRDKGRFLEMEVKPEGEKFLIMFSETQPRLDKSKRDLRDFSRVTHRASLHVKTRQEREDIRKDFKSWAYRAGLSFTVTTRAVDESDPKGPGYRIMFFDNRHEDTP